MIFFQLFNIIRSLYVFIFFFFYQNLFLNERFVISKIHDINFSFPIIKTLPFDDEYNIITMLPKFLAPGIVLKIHHRNSGEDYLISYKDGIINWNNIFNNMPIELTYHSDLD